MALNDAGQMVTKWYDALSDKFPTVENGEWVVMPNHIHAIIRIALEGTPERGLPQIVQWFKTMTTNEYIRGVKQGTWPPFEQRLWQRNYWEHIIRDEEDYQRIASYIASNPLRWHDDQLHP